MADSLVELLAPSLKPASVSGTEGLPSAAVSKYLTRLTTLSLDALNTTEPQSLAQSSHSVTLSLQALSNRSHRSIITAADSLSTLHTSLPTLTQESAQLRNAVPRLDEETVRFSTTYSKSGQNAILDRRKQAMLLSRNVDRVSDILDLPTLLSTAISSSSNATSSGSSSSGMNYSSALDLYAHIKRLQLLYPTSPIIKSVMVEADEAMKEMTTNLIASLRSQQNIRLAAAIRTIGWLRRVAPGLSATANEQSKRTTADMSPKEGSFGALFLVCRLANLLLMLDALAPLRDLADQESKKRQSVQAEPASSKVATGSGRKASFSRNDVLGQQSERYLKRYIEIFREQSFSTISMYKNIFTSESVDSSDTTHGELLPLPSALQTFPMHLVDLLTETLRLYLPNISDRSARESILTQVLYTAGSLGRLGADFSLIIALLDEALEEQTSQGGMGDTEEDIPEWQRVMRKHRVQASRLEALASGHGLS